ncbi:hypothetical protein Ndes2526B_g08547 [Nannochloris sp. 'desiccata']|nr:hypothetical protein KSW81_001857 [Chlorella desiccata (nom. nud.)]KAH7616454.1 hypothetical protein NADE_001273 [Chlorella desiccata (nom. nud.)]
MEDFDLQSAPAAGDDCIIISLKCISQSDPLLKASYTKLAYGLWKAGDIILPSPGKHHGLAPERPGRNNKVKLVSPAELPRRGKGGTLASRQALLHSLCHIECCAIDLAWDIIARFGADPDYAANLPRDFYSDWIQVAEDEARHFSLLLLRLQAAGLDYGSLAAHDGLWESAMETAGSLAARLSVEHAVHEARGLDILPQTIARFRAGGDNESADLLENVIYNEEISHCGAGVRWLKHLYGVATQQGSGSSGGGQQQDNSGHKNSTADVPKERSSNVPDWIVDANQYSTVEGWFHSLVRKHFHGFLKPPFNDEARKKAGFLPDWYLPLAAAPAPAGAAIEPVSVAANR